MNVRHPLGILHSFSIKNIFNDKMDLRLFCFLATKCTSGLDCKCLLKYILRKQDHVQSLW